MTSESTDASGARRLEGGLPAPAVPSAADPGDPRAGSSADDGDARPAALDAGWPRDEEAGWPRDGQDQTAPLPPLAGLEPAQSGPVGGPASGPGQSTSPGQPQPYSAENGPAAQPAPRAGEPPDQRAYPPDGQGDGRRTEDAAGGLAPGQGGEQRGQDAAGAMPTARGGEQRAERPERPTGPRAARPQQRRPRRARLVVQKVDPWSVFLFSLVASICLGIVLLVAVATLYAVLSSLGVLASVNNVLGEVLGSNNPDQAAAPAITASGVLGATAVLALVDVVLLTVLATLGALLYNLCASLTGGIEVQLRERD